MTKLSKHEKIILLVLAESKGEDQWHTYRRIRLAIVGDLGMPYSQTREFNRNRRKFRRHQAPQDRPEYDEDRRRKNIVHASVSRSLVRLVARGLVEWTEDVFGDRTPAITDQGAIVAAQLKADGAVVVRDFRAEKAREAQRLQALQEVISKATGILKQP
jgi:hypothetical protein